MRLSLRLVLVVAILSALACGQSTNATITGRIVDQTGSLVTDAKVEAISLNTNIHYTGRSNAEGVFAIPSLPPGPFRIEASKAGFKTVVRDDVVLRVQDVVALNFTLPVGSVAETVTVRGGIPLVNTSDASVSTVVDRQFAENLPMNGRSFQTLIQLTPGVVTTATNFEDGGQFSINGQRADSNYWMVDGVGANIGSGVSPTGNAGNGLAGALGSFNALGGTNSLVSVDAMQEFRIQTSTYAPEFGRTPGGQISIVTRSGTNQFHGTLFDYLRNSVLDASDWFNGFTNTPPLPKAQERQNDFGGTFSGPLLRDKTFFFFSYEGLRLHQPQTTLTTVPDLAARQAALPSIQPFLNSFPFDPTQPELGNGIAQFNASYVNPASLDAFSLRVDQGLTKSVHVFGRYDYSPSEIKSRGSSAEPLSSISDSRITVQTATLGAIWSLSTQTANDLRFNYSRTNASNFDSQDAFGGAVPINSFPFPVGFSAQNALFGFPVLALQNGFLVVGPTAHNFQRQINIVDNYSVQKSNHALKLGVDFRRLTPVFDPAAYSLNPLFITLASAEAGRPLINHVTSSLPATFLFRDLGLFAQDTWRVLPRLTLTYGVRWDIGFTPESIKGPSFPAVRNFDLNDLSKLSLAAPSTSPYPTTYGNVAPRLGIAYEISTKENWQTVIRGGWGIFYDLAGSELGNTISGTSYPFGADQLSFGGTFPLNPAPMAPAVAPPPATTAGALSVVDPGLKSPYTFEWNVALEQGVGKQQTISASYVGAAGRRLLLSTGGVSLATNPNIPHAAFVTNFGTSNYQALQLQYKRNLSRGLQVLSSYTWAHSIDTGSAGSLGETSNVLVPQSIAGLNRGPSDFDIRHTFSAGLTYDIPAPKSNAFVNALAGGWSTENHILARSAAPVDVSDAIFFEEFQNGFAGDVRPDLVQGVPLYLFGSQFPGGKALNPAAFTDVPFDPTTRLPLRQGTTSRNFLRGFGATQWDFAVHRNFPLHENVALQFRAEMFNVLNHPNFGSPQGAFGFPGFGQSNSMLGQSLAGFGSTAAGSFSPLYQIGGPRSIQLALKLVF